MLAICIPIYNQDVTRLIAELEKQIKGVNHPIEIVLIDDASQANYKSLNEPLSNRHTYIELKENIGRSRIRNLFLKYTSATYLLFLDCDALIHQPDFLKEYFQSIENKKLVVCGGRVNQKEPPNRSHYLNWKYSTLRESVSVEKRLQKPNLSFMTNNFLIERKTFETVLFDERLINYGHEDTLFGFELMKRGISIAHIDNPIFNGDIEDNTTYLFKTELGLKNLSTICKSIDNDPQFISSVRLLEYYFTIQNSFTLLVIRNIYRIGKPIIRKRLESGYGSLKLFDFYKLGYFDELFRKKNED